jgi:hypothetical protein
MTSNSTAQLAHEKAAILTKETYLRLKRNAEELHIDDYLKA